MVNISFANNAYQPPYQEFILEDKLFINKLKSNKGINTILQSTPQYLQSSLKEEDSKSAFNCKQSQLDEIIQTIKPDSVEVPEVFLASNIDF